jgi:hypothetical protein
LFLWLYAPSVTQKTKERKYFLGINLQLQIFAKGQEKPSNIRTNTAYACVSFKLDNSIRKPPLCPNMEMHVLSIADE